MDMYPQMLAYNAGGLDIITAMLRAGQIRNQQSHASTNIDQDKKR